jgi:hypothetical protein
VGNGNSINIWEDNWVVWQNGYKCLLLDRTSSTFKLSVISP